MKELTDLITKGEVALSEQFKTIAPEVWRMTREYVIICGWLEMIIPIAVLIAMSVLLYVGYKCDEYGSDPVSHGYDHPLSVLGIVLFIVTIAVSFFYIPDGFIKLYATDYCTLKVIVGAIK